MEADVWFVVAALAQALAAIAVAVFTGKLVQWTRKLSEFTNNYVDEMRRLNQLQAEANELTRTSLQVAELASAPRLVLRRDGRSEREDVMRAEVDVENVGGGIAQRVVLVTDWGEGEVYDPVLRPGMTSKARVLMARGDWEPLRGTSEQDPVPQRVRFVDTYGRQHDVPVVEGVSPGMWVATAAPGGSDPGGIE